jgi:hypothetical protein
VSIADVEVKGMDEVREILDGRNIEWSFGDIDLSKVDLARSLTQNSRGDDAALSEYWVETYALAYKNKETLPPIVCMEAGATSKKLLTLSGLHRVTAARRAGLKSLPGFTVGPLSEILRLYVINEGNRKVGYGLSEDHRLEMAIRFVRQGSTASAAAREVGIDKGKVINRVARMRADERIQKITPRWTSLSPASRQRLDAIQSDDLLKKTCDLVLAAKMTGTEVNNLVRDVQKGKTDVVKEDILATQWEVYRTRIESGGKNRAKTNAQLGVMSLLRSSVTRLANPGSIDLMDELILTIRPEFPEHLVAARDFLVEAVKRSEAVRRPQGVNGNAT